MIAAQYHIEEHRQLEILAFTCCSLQPWKIQALCPLERLLSTHQTTMCYDPNDQNVMENYNRWSNGLCTRHMISYYWRALFLCTS